MKVFDGLRVCLLALRPASEDEFPREWAAKARTLVLETQRDGDNRRAAISGSDVAWTINGRPAPLDSMAQAWQKAVVDLADAAYQADALRRQDADLRSQIDSLPQRIAATKAEIDLIKKRESAISLAIADAAKRQSQLQAQISAAQRQRMAAQSQVSQARRAVSAARDQAARAQAEQQLQAAEQALMNADMAVSSMDAQMNSAESSRRLADLQDALRALNADKSLTLLRLKLSTYESIRPEDVQLEIQSLDVATRQPALDAEVQAALARLKTLLR